MGSAVRLLRGMAHNNAWSNHRLLEACGRLPPGAWEATRTGFFPSIRDTLNHILAVDRFYVSALEGNPLGPAAFARVLPCPEFAALERAQRTVDRRLIAVCGRLDGVSLDAPVSLPRGDWVQVEPTDRLLLHLFQHQIHHRGQAHAMLSATTVAPPQLDEFFPADPKERALRADDMAALGFDECRIWRQDRDQVTDP